MQYDSHTNTKTYYSVGDNRATRGPTGGGEQSVYSGATTAGGLADIDTSNNGSQCLGQHDEEPPDNTGVASTSGLADTITRHYGGHGLGQDDSAQASPGLENDLQRREERGNDRDPGENDQQRSGEDGEPRLEFDGDESHVVDKFWIEYENEAYHVENHGNHNFSCWKNQSVICRFKLPANAWNQISGIIQLELVKGMNKSDPVTYNIYSAVKGVQPQSHISWQRDNRCLVVALTSRTGDDVTLRDPTNPAETGLNVDVEWHPHAESEDPEGRNNGLMSPCSALILVIAKMHNNLQHISKGGMGDVSYIAKYVTKGIGNLQRSLPLLHSCLMANRESVHEDALTNEYRPALMALQQCINAGSKMTEYSRTMMLGFLMGMSQFPCSHQFENINVYALRKSILTNADEGLLEIHPFDSDESGLNGFVEEDDDDGNYNHEEDVADSYYNHEGYDDGNYDHEEAEGNGSTGNIRYYCSF
jgi:hypothetical protein